MTMPNSALGFPVRMTEDLLHLALLAVKACHDEEMTCACPYEWGWCILSQPWAKKLMKKTENSKPRAVPKGETMHSVTRDRMTPFTDCCGMRLSELPAKHFVTLGLYAVNCPAAGEVVR